MMPLMKSGIENADVPIAERNDDAVHEEVPARRTAPEDGPPGDNRQAPAACASGTGSMRTVGGRATHQRRHVASVQVQRQNRRIESERLTPQG